MGSAYLVPQLADELLIARKRVRTVLDEAAEGPEPQRRLAVLLDDVQMWVVRPATHLARLLDDRVDALRKGVVEDLQRGLARYSAYKPKHLNENGELTLPPRRTS